jgi:hypothetical protein
MLKIRTVFLFLFVVLVTRLAYADPGILLLAHGGNAAWNARVTDLAAQVNRTRPTEVAFGMATRATIQSAIDCLVARGDRDCCRSVIRVVVEFDHHLDGAPARSTVPAASSARRVRQDEPHAIGLRRKLADRDRRP